MTQNPWLFAVLLLQRQLLLVSYHNRRNTFGLFCVVVVTAATALSGGVGGGFVEGWILLPLAPHARRFPSSIPQRPIPSPSLLWAAAKDSSAPPMAPADERYYSPLEDTSTLSGSSSSNNGGSTSSSSSSSWSTSSSSSTTSSSSSTTTTTTPRRITLTRYLDQAVQANPELREMTSLLLAVQMACKTISNLVHRAGLAHTEHETSTTPSTTSQKNITTTAPSSPFADGRYYSMQRLDQLSTTVLKNALKFTGKCRVTTPPVRTAQDVADHQPGVLLARSVVSSSENDNDTTSTPQWVACLDPLDGSGNADASICTGTIFGVFESQATGGGHHSNDNNTNSTQTSNPNKNDNDDNDDEDDDDDWLMAQVLQPAHRMKAAGYCLYSSATVLVFTLDNATSVQGFTLDPQTQEFVLTHANLTIPPRGSVYSANMANAAGWAPAIQQYFANIAAGKGESQERYALRYVGSLVGDVHRTLLYGGLFAYPADSHSHPDGNLQLLYKTAPLAKLVTAAGGLAWDEGTAEDLCHVTPSRVHAKRPCFLGSRDDMLECQTYLRQALEERQRQETQQQKE